MAPDGGRRDKLSLAMTERSILRSYYLIAGLYTLAASLIWGVNTLFLLDAGLDLMGVFVANTFFALGNVAFEIPTGVMADTKGRRASFLWSVAILLVTTLGYLAVARWGGGLMAFSAVSFLIGLGYTFYSGAVESWLVDALKASGFTGQLDSVFARGSMVTGVAMLVGSALGGFLGGVDLAIPYLVRIGLLGVVFVVAYFTMHDLGFAPRAVSLQELPAEMKRIAGDSLAYGWQQRDLRFLMICSFVQLGFLTWAYHAWQPYFLELLGRDVVWVAGVVAALIAVASIIGNAIVDRVSRYCGKRTTVLLWAAVILSLASLAVGMVESFYLAVGLFLIAIAAMGVIGPTRQAYLHHMIPSNKRASVISFDSMLGNAGASIAQPGLGHLARTRSLADGYVFGGLATLLVLPLLYFLRRGAGEADLIAGTRCPVAPFGGQGLTDANLIDATPRRAYED
jgi:MFS family permease